MRRYFVPVALSLLLTFTAACSQAPVAPTPSVQPSGPVETPAPTPPAEGPVWEDEVYASDFTADDGTVLLSVSYTLPFLKNAGDYAPWMAVNEYFDAVEQELAASAQARAAEAEGDYAFSAQTGLPYTPSSEEMSYTLKRQTGRLVSLLREYYVTAEGIAHPTVFYWSEQLDLTTGRKLAFGDCFTDPEAAAERARQAVLNSPEILDLEAAGVSEDTLSDFFAQEHFYLTDAGFVFWYQTGELGANASPVEVAVPYRAFQGLAQPWLEEG